MTLSWRYVPWANVGPVAALFFGLKAAVLAIVFQAVFRIGSRALGSSARMAVAVAAFAAIFLFDVPIPLVVVLAGIIGYVAGRAGNRTFAGGGGHGASNGLVVSDEESAPGPDIPVHAVPNIGWAARVGGTLLALWLAPVALLAALPGPDSAFTNIATFFSQMAVVTFGGAYAVLAYVAQEAVGTYGW